MEKAVTAVNHFPENGSHCEPFSGKWFTAVTAFFHFLEDVLKRTKTTFPTVEKHSPVKKEELHIYLFL